MKKHNERNTMDLGCPESITKIQHGSDMIFIRRNFTPKAFFLLFFCVVWDGFLLFWYFGAPAENMPLIGKLFPIGHLAVGIGLTYYTISLFINKTEIVFRNGMLSIRDFPLPMGNTKTVNGDDFVQLYVKRKITSGENSTSISYILMGITKQGKTRKLVKGMHEEEEGLFLEQELEKLLDISPETVKGEVG